MTCEGGAGTDEQGGTDKQGVTNEGVPNEARKRRGKVLDAMKGFSSLGDALEGVGMVVGMKVKVAESIYTP